MQTKFSQIKSHQFAFTLVELLVTLSILAILMSIALPFIIDLFKRWEARQIHSMVSSSYYTSKAESLIRQQNVIMCLTDNDRKCNRDAHGFILIFADKNNNKHFDQNIDTMISESALNLDHGRVHLRVGARRHYIKFFGDTGLPRGHFGHIKYCPSDNKTTYMYQVSINQQGISRFKHFNTHNTGCP